MSVMHGNEEQAAGQVPDLGRVRQMWHLLEPLHAVVYYAPEAFEEAAALGLAVDERWPSYFVWRAAPLGPVGAERVAAAFYSFSPEMVAGGFRKKYLRATSRLLALTAAAQQKTA